MHANVVDLENVGMRQCRDGAGLGLEPLDRRRVGGGPLQQDLHRDLAMQASVLGDVYLAHAASAKRLQDLVGAESLSDQLNARVVGPDPNVTLPHARSRSPGLIA